MGSFYSLQDNVSQVTLSTLAQIWAPDVYQPLINVLIWTIDFQFQIASVWKEKNPGKNQMDFVFNLDPDTLKSNAHI